ncbi:MAG: DMT family transporter [Candidatus Azobacteroides sp.]|nr:DMT family transporter [Candidatus Azobacteroides sp.]
MVHWKNNWDINYWYHLLAFIVVFTWGTTFVSTKVLLIAGLTPENILVYRFILAYIGIWFLGKNQLFSKTWKDELLFLLLGVFGGSLYFLTENTALKFTQASNVSLLVCTAPLFTALLSHFIIKTEKLKLRMINGSIIAFFGMALVVFNGHFILKLSPVGDLLSICAALCWAFYTIIFKQISSRYNSLFITRKVFFYGLVTIAPVFLFRPLITDLAILSNPVVWGNLLFLGLIASLCCYFAWNVVIKQLGAIRSSNYIYLNPLATLITSSIVIHEKITGLALVGAALILIGVFWVEKGMPLTYINQLLKKS